jgi:hypothetical protein
MKLILLIINCTHSGKSIDIANPTFSSHPNRYERRRLALVAKQSALYLRQEVIHHAPFEYSRSSRSFFFWLAPLTIVDKSPTVERTISVNIQIRMHVRGCRLTWQLEGEVQRREQDGKEDPPSQHACDESASASSDEQGASLGHVTLSEVPVRAGEAAESRNEGSEDADEDHVGAERANHVDEAEETHPELEETCEEKNRVSMVFSLGIAWDGHRSLPKLALNPGVLAPSAKAPVALYSGIMVKPKVSQKAPKEPKTTNGKVLPMIHCGELASGMLCMDVIDDMSSIAHLAD